MPGVRLLAMKAGEVMRHSLGILLAALILATFCSPPSFAQVAGRPSVVRAVPPVFPLPEGGPNAMGSVVVEARVAASGEVVEAKATHGHPALYRAAETAARRWLFSPLAGQNKVRAVRLTFVFKFMDEGASEEDLLPLFEPPYRIEVRRILPAIKSRETK